MSSQFLYRSTAGAFTNAFTSEEVLAMKILILAPISLAVAASGAFALAHGSGGIGGMMGHHMQGCMQMMQSISGAGAHPPNKQWRHRQPGPGAEGYGDQPPAGSSSQ